MTDEKHVHDAFLAVHVPPEVAQKTRERIESLRAEEANTSKPHLVVTQTKRPPRHRSRLIGALAACLIVVALVVSGGFYFLAPAAYVSIDVNPSLELGVNRLGLVSDTQALNADGEAILAQTDVRWMSYEDALNSIKTEMDSYTSSDAVIEITVVCDEQAWSNELADEGMRCFETGNGRVVCSHASSHERTEAHNAGMGIAKWRIYTQLVEAGVAISPEEASEMTMRELYDLAARENVSLSNDTDTTSSGSSEATGAQELRGKHSHSNSKQRGKHHAQ